VQRNLIFLFGYKQSSGAEVTLFPVLRVPLLNSLGGALLFACHCPLKTNRVPAQPVYCELLPLVPKDDPPEDSALPVDEPALTPKCE
jgi:hypothetical protein